VYYAYCEATTSTCSGFTVLADDDSLCPVLTSGNSDYLDAFPVCTASVPCGVPCECRFFRVSARVHAKLLTYSADRGKQSQPWTQPCACVLAGSCLSNIHQPMIFLLIPLHSQLFALGRRPRRWRKLCARRSRGCQQLQIRLSVSAALLFPLAKKQNKKGFTRTKPITSFTTLLCITPMWVPVQSRYLWHTDCLLRHSQKKGGF
jgi:hypothetical protein